MRRWGTVAAVLLVLALMLWAARRDIGAPRPEVSQATPSPPAERVRVRVPHPSAARAAPSGAAPVAAAAPVAVPPPSAAKPASEAPAAAHGQMVDRREDAPPDAAAVREALVDQMDVVKAAVLPCVTQWTAVEAGVAGAVTLAFQLDADGLTDVWIQDHAAVPDTLLSCFSDAVYASDWAGISREPLQVTWPFEVSDAGDDKAPAAR